MSKYLPATWYDPRIEIHESAIHGKGLFARELIRAGETVMIWGGTIYTPQDLQDIRDGKLKVEPFSYSYIDEDIMMAAPPDGLDYFVNHSCDPSVWMADEVTVVARAIFKRGRKSKGITRCGKPKPIMCLNLATVVRRCVVARLRVTIGRFSKCKHATKDTSSRTSAAASLG